MLFLLLLSGVAAAASPPAPSPRPIPATPEALEAWWARQRERESTDRAREGPGETRRNATRDQIERWEQGRLRGQGRRPDWPR